MIFPALKKTLWQMLGPSIILVALSLSGGEMLLWPNLSANFGLNILWPIPIILLLQFFVNIEIERYTLVTGKSVEESLVGSTKWLAVIFALTVLVALVWPAWITTSGNLLAYVFGLTGDTLRNTGLVLSIALLFATVIIFRRPETYKILEKMARVSLCITLLIIFFIVAIKFDLGLFVEGLKGFFHFGYIPSSISRFDFVAALAYGGVSGVLNLVQSEWIKDKGYGINSLSESEKKMVELQSVESKKNYKKWFSMINKEHFFIYVLANFFSIFLLAYLGRLLLPLGSAQGFQVLTAEIDVLNASLPYLGLLFALSGTIIFIMANITILDAIGRLVYRLITPFRTKKSATSVSRFISSLSSSRISEYSVYIGVAILLLSLLIPSFKQPFFLLVTSASLSAFTMWIYPPLLLKINFGLPEVARPSIFRSLFVILTTLFYGAITLWALSAYIPMWGVFILGFLVSLYHVVTLFSIKHHTHADG
jgi:hypothetical protein